MKKWVLTLLASGFGSGFFPVAPATFASLVWLAVYLLVPGAGILVSPLVVAPSLIAAIVVSGMAERFHGRDAHCIVIDEFVGMQVTFLSMQPHLVTGVIGFILFRILDIAKPFPAGYSQRLKGGLGVVMDDAIAGVYARLGLFLLSLVFKWGANG